jgi:predicted metal-binding transcription factor (methanogenesis marker protein 9)
MHIDLIDQLIKENRFDDFKLAFKGIPLNAHHKALIFDKCFLSGNSDFVDYMSHQISPSKDQLSGLLIQTLRTPLNKKLLKHLDSLTDTDVISKFDTLIIESLLKNQDQETFGWIVDKFPLTVYKNFKSVTYSSIKNDKFELIAPLLKTKLDTDTCFNICLCCFEYKKPDLVNRFLREQIVVNPEVINELKENQSELFKRYLQQKKLRQQQLAQWKAWAAAQAAAQALKDAANPKKKKKVVQTVAPTNQAVQQVQELPKEELMNMFLEQNLAQALHDYLAEKFPPKADDKPARKSKI